MIRGMLLLRSKHMLTTWRVKWDTTRSISQTLGIRTARAVRSSGPIWTGSCLWRVACYLATASWLSQTRCLTLPLKKCLSCVSDVHRLTQRGVNRHFTPLNSLPNNSRGSEFFTFSLSRCTDKLSSKLNFYHSKMNLDACIHCFGLN